MANLPWLEEVRKRLVRHGLPPAYIQRFVEELADHFHDLKEENMEADSISRLGEPAQVANAAVAAYRRRSFLGRHPVAAFLTFAITPILPQFLLGYAAFFPIALAVEVLKHFQLCGLQSPGELGPVPAMAWCCFFSLMIAACSALASLLYGELAAWLGISRKWMFASCTVLAAMAVLWEFSLHDDVGLYGLVFPLQFLVPIAVGWWSAQRRHGQNYPVTAFFIFAASPVMLLMALWSVVGLASWSRELNVVIDIILAVAPSLFYCKVAWPSGIGRKWAILLFTVPGTFAAILFAWFYASHLILLVLLSLLYCHLAWRSGTGRRWLFASCAILATFAAISSFGFVISSSGEAGGSLGSLEVYSLMALQALVPLAIAWWFVRRRRDGGQLQLAT